MVNSSHSFPGSPGMQSIQFSIFIRMYVTYIWTYIQMRMWMLTQAAPYFLLCESSELELLQCSTWVVMEHWRSPQRTKWKIRTVLTSQPHQFQRYVPFTIILCKSERSNVPIIWKIIGKTKISSSRFIGFRVEVETNLWT